jgi:hypothetical protein
MQTLADTDRSRAIALLKRALPPGAGVRLVDPRSSAVYLVEPGEVPPFLIRLMGEETRATPDLFTPPRCGAGSSAPCRPGPVMASCNTVSSHDLPSSGPRPEMANVTGQRTWQDHFVASESAGGLKGAAARDYVGASATRSQARERLRVQGFAGAVEIPALCC